MKRRGSDLSRREFLARMAAATGAMSVAGFGEGPFGAAKALADLPPLPPPKKSGIDHIVQVMMENRSFDHFLGWVPGADGVQAGLEFPNVEGEMVETFRLSQDPDYGFQGCGWADPNHGYGGGRVHMNGGAMDGWLLTDGTVSNPTDRFPVGYYTDEDLPFYAGVAKHFTISDRYFHGILTSTFPNRIYIHAGATDRMSNLLPYAQQAPSKLPTIWDKLLNNGISARNYFFDLPTPGLWGTKYLGILAPFPQFLADAALGTLPSVSYIDPFFAASVGEGLGVSRDDHPKADVRDGQALLGQIYDALRKGPHWDTTLLVVTYDEWGGFYDHVVPGFAPISDKEARLGNDGRLGFRVPCAIVGPRAHGGRVSHLDLDPTSFLNMVAWRFGIQSVGARRDWSTNMAYALDFENPPNYSAPSFRVPKSLLGFGQLCTDSLGLGLDPHNRELNEVMATIRSFGVPV